LTPSSPLHPAGLVSYRRHSWGSPFRGFSLPTAGASLDVPCPSWRLLSTIARPVMSPEHRSAVARVRARSVVRVATRLPNCTLPRESEWESCARTQPVSSAPPGVSARIGSPYSGRRVLPRTMGADPLLGFSALQGSPPPRLDPADAESPLVRFLAACEQAVHGRFRVSIGGEVGWSLSRLPPLLGFLSSSWEPTYDLDARAFSSRGRARCRTRCRVASVTRDVGGPARDILWSRAKSTRGSGTN
jgi:hypothetical protein